MQGIRAFAWMINWKGTKEQGIIVAVAKDFQQILLNLLKIVQSQDNKYPV